MIPPQPWYMQKYFAVLVGGVLPFGAVFIEVFFIMSSIWLHHYYYMFGFLLLVFVILILTSAEITIVMTYFQLCAVDWRVFSTLFVGVFGAVFLHQTGYRGTFRVFVAVLWIYALGLHRLLPRDGNHWILRHEPFCIQNIWRH